MQSPLSKETASADVTQPIGSETLPQIFTTNIHPCASEDESKESEESLNDYAKIDEKNSSDFPAVFDADDFFSLLKTEEYNGSDIIPVPGCGQVIVKPTIKCDPIFPDFEMLQFMEPIKQSSPTKDCIAPTDTCDEKSLYALLSTFEQWMQTLSKKIPLGHPSAQDFMEYSKEELKRGLNTMGTIHKRMNNLLDAVVALPDPTSFFESESESIKILIRYRIIVAGVKVQEKLKLIQEEIDVNYKMFVTINSDDAKIWAKRCKDFLLILLNKLSGEYLTLCTEVDNFRQLIREFCIKINKLV